MRAQLTRWLIVALLLGTAIYALAEDITLTTYYPSPRGVYQELKTAGDLVVGDITNPPAARLHVVQEGAAPALRVDDELGDTSPVLIDQSGNVGIGTDSPDASAGLEIAGASKGLLFPRTTPNQIDAPVAGLTIYNTATNRLDKCIMGRGGPLRSRSRTSTPYHPVLLGERPVQPHVILGMR